MAYRLRKRIKIAPGIYLNASASGLSASVGLPGANLSFGSRGTYLNTKVPGLPLYQRQQLTGGSRSSARPKRVSQVDMDRSEYLAAPPATAEIGPDGTIILKDASGIRLDDRQHSLAWKYGGELIMLQVGTEVEARRRQLRELEELHMKIPPPDRQTTLRLEAFSEPAPMQPIRRKYHWFLKLFPFHRRNVDAINIQIDSAHSQVVAEHEDRKAEHRSKEVSILSMYRQRDSNGHDGLERFFEWHLQQLSWPKETIVSFELSTDCKTLHLDIDLPEIQHMPDGHHEMSANGKKVKWKAIGEVAKRKTYMSHVHGIGLRLTGEAFSQLHPVDTVVVAGYSQRPNGQTALVEDQYLYSSRITRAAWSAIAFDQLNHLDPVSAYDRFETRRKMSATGIFKPIEPFNLGA